MGQSLFEKIQSKLELFRLEKRYTRSRHRRSAFVSNAIYVDGEYIYQTPNTTGSSSSSSSTSSNSSTRINALHGERPSPPIQPPAIHPMIPEHHSYSSSSQMPSSPSTTTTTSSSERKRTHRYSSMPAFGGTFDINKSASRVHERRLSMIR